MEDVKLIKLVSCATEIEADMLVNLLKANEIECVRKDNFTGDYMKISTGASIFGVELYVNEQDYGDAKELVKYDEETKLDDMLIEDSMIDVSIFNKKRILAIIMICVMVMGGLISLIIYLLEYM